MLPREYRLPPRTSSERLFSYTSPYFISKVFPSSLPHPRFGFIVSKKVSPVAVKRNKVKRQLRAGIEQFLPRIKPGYDILFIVQKPSIEADRESIKEHLLQFLTKKDLLT